MKLAMTRPLLMSIVPGHEGYCQQTWLNRSSIDQRTDAGISGFFRRLRPVPGLPFLLIRRGPEFHGIVRHFAPTVVLPTGSSLSDSLIRRRADSYIPREGDPAAQPPRQP